MSAFTLKLIALLSMVTDHTASLLVPLGPAYFLMRAFGRMAFLLYGFLLAEGFRHTRSASRYARRLFLMGLLSQIPYAFTLNSGFGDLLSRFASLNILFTLGCGVLLMQFLQSDRLSLTRQSRVWGLLPLALIPTAFAQFGVWELSLLLSGLLTLAAAAMFLRGVLPRNTECVADWALKTAIAIALYQLIHNWSERLFTVGLEFDYGFYALLFFALLWPARSRRSRTAAMLAFVLFFYPPWYDAAESFFALAATVLTIFYNGKRGPNDHRLFYWAYPAHLTVLWALFRS